MNQNTKALTALIALASSTAFAAGSTQTAAQVPTIPAAQARPAAPAIPVAPQGAAVTPAAPQPGQVCAPHPMKGQGLKGQGNRSQVAPGNVTPGNTAAPAANVPAAMKNAPARPAVGGRTAANCGPLGARHADLERRGGTGRGYERPGAQQPGHGAAQGPQGQGDPRDQNQRSQQAPGAQIPRTPVTDAACLQNQMTRIDALLASTTDAGARGYLNDARTLARSGNVRAAQSLLRAAEAINRVQK